MDLINFFKYYNNMGLITRPVGEEFKLYKHHPHMADTIVILSVIETNKDNCSGCYLKGMCNTMPSAKETAGYCSETFRDDGKNVVFVKTKHL